MTKESTPLQHIPSECFIIFLEHIVRSEIFQSYGAEVSNCLCKMYIILGEPVWLCGIHPQYSHDLSSEPRRDGKDRGDPFFFGLFLVYYTLICSCIQDSYWLALKYIRD